MELIQLNSGENLKDLLKKGELIEFYNSDHEMLLSFDNVRDEFKCMFNGKFIKITKKFTKFEGFDCNLIITYDLLNLKTSVNKKG